MNDDRLEYLVGTDAVSDIVQRYDLDEESDLIEFVEQWLPLPSDTPMREVRMAVRTIAVTQILADEPPETWQAVQRMRDAGLDREDLLTQLEMVLGEYVSIVIESQTPFDATGYAEELSELPLPTLTDVARVLIDIVREHQGIVADDHFEQALDVLASGDRPAVEALVDRVTDELILGPLHWLPGDETVHVPDLVDGRTFTHRFNDAEADLQVLFAGFDLGAFDRFDTVRLADGTELDQFSVERDHLAWRGPDGWLSAFTPGDLLAVTVDVDAPDGGAALAVDAVVDLAVIDVEPAMVDEVIAAVRNAYEELVAEPGLPVSGEDLALLLCHRHDALFTGPQRPLAELCSAAGLTLRGGQVAHDEAVWRRGLLHERLHQVMELVPEPEWRSVLGRALEVLDDPDAPIDEVRASLDECAEPETLDVLADVLFPHLLEVADEFELDGAGAPGLLFELVGRATAVARRPREVATAEFLACVLHERCGSPDIAERHLVRAADAQPRLGPVVERLGWYRFDRGDARGAMKWWRTLSELPAAATTIEPFLAPGSGRKLGRNEPCWCGSGRKYKQCHQNDTDHGALPDRIAWLCRKATVWLEHSAGDLRDVVVQAALARATGDPDADPIAWSQLDDDRLADLFEVALSDPIVFDTALHEGGLFAVFLRERAALLPDDERRLAESWLSVDRAVHEVVGADPGVSLTLRNLATDAVVEVRERTASRDVEPGDLYCARVVPDGVTHQIVGGAFSVRRGDEDEVLDLCAGGDVAALCAWAANEAPTSS